MRIKQTTRALFLLATLMLALLPRIVQSQDATMEQSKNKELSQEDALKSLTSTNIDIRLKTAVQLDYQREQFIGALISIVDGTNSDMVKVDAVVVLGDYQATEAIPVIMQHMELNDVPHGVIFNATRETGIEVATKMDPVSFALINIGMPAVHALLDKIMQTDDAKITAECVRICEIIEGEKVTQFRLKGLLNHETDSKRKERLQSALDYQKKSDAEANSHLSPADAALLDSEEYN